ncbi:MAG: sigma 54-interacting transcriptional regulator [Tissierellia bacterium]|nr:sigma 54-interacting transcriptional regulator [Tissierellia bacterium]
MRLEELIEPNLMGSCEILFKIFEDINIAITVIDENLITRLWNASAEKNYGISREEILNKPILDFFPNALLPKVVKEERTYKNVYNSPRDNCHNFISATPLYSGDKVIGGIGYDRDISDLMNMSELLDKTQLNLSKLELELSKFNNDKSSFKEIIGRNEKFLQIIELAKSVAKSNLSILITGESGTGKEIFTRAIHKESEREGYFVPINCSAIPTELMESELFGYETGSFTGALKDGKIGKFELANGGTLFLDEIGDMPLSMQSKILRVLDDGVVTKIGSETSTQLDVRIIAATNKNIIKMVEEGTFRKDLYYRLNGVLIHIPPLRERKEDIPELVNEFVEKFCIEYSSNIKGVDPDLMIKLKQLDWEGNIRELKSVVKVLVIHAISNNSKNLEARFLPDNIIEKVMETTVIGEMDKDQIYSLDINNIVEKVEKETIIKAMSIAKGSKTEAAKLLNIPRSTLYFKMDKYNI